MLTAGHATHTWVVGQTIGRYTLLDRIGTGGMGEVWKAHDQTLDRTVAIKMLHGQAAADEVGRERFRREALTLSRLSHAGIATKDREH